MLNQGWLPLNDYSMKYNISISTLRRRIRSGSIEHQFRDGKYWLKDKPISRAYQTNRPDLASVSTPPAVAATLSTQGPTPAAQASAPTKAPTTAEDLRALEMANQLVAELRSAYVQILQEKEEQILLLKEEAADLRTLVRILESENQKLKGQTLTEPPGEWLAEP